MTAKRGVYFLANDYVLDRAIAFLNSFRRFNPDTPLCLIPFADDIDGLLEYRHRFDFSLWDGDPALLASCDEISRLFHGETKGHYRKLAAWEGEFDEFVYIDTDTIVLHDFDFLFGYLAGSDFITGFSDIPECRKWVWRESIHDAGVLDERQIGYSGGTGIIASKKACLRFADVLPSIPAALELAPHMELLTYEMPLLNYLMVTSGRRFTSLHVMHQAGYDVPLEQWAGEHLAWSQRSDILMVHWAGLWWHLGRGEIDELPNRDLFDYYRHLEDERLYARR